jgi:hypothetical protein
MPGTVTFTRFFDAPGAAPCSGTPIVLPAATLVLTNAGSAPPIALAGSAPVSAAGPGTYRFVASYSGDANYAALAPTPCGAPDESVVISIRGPYRPLDPARILDTRDGTGGILGPIGPGTSVDVQVTGRGGVPASGVSAVAVNVTATQPTASAT